LIFDVSKLPTREIPGLIPVNSTGHHLNIHKPPPTSLQWEKYNHRCLRKKLCNDLHLYQNCSDTYCKLDYLPLDADEDYCLRYVRREHPCAEEGRCRYVDCPDGRICQRESCAKGIHKTTCTLMHDVDYEVAEWVRPNDGARGSGTSSPYEPQIPELNLIDL
jgi:hypothetical protein